MILQGWQRAEPARRASRAGQDEPSRAKDFKLASRASERVGSLAGPKSHPKKFSVLRDFCGGMASIFPNTATVESDFSILGWEKDEYRKSLTDLSLEGIIYCKQFELLSALTS